MVFCMLSGCEFFTLWTGTRSTLDCDINSVLFYPYHVYFIALFFQRMQLPERGLQFYVHLLGASVKNWK